MNLIAAWPRLMSPELAESYVGGPTILGAMKRQKVVMPRVAHSQESETAWRLVEGGR